MDLDGRLPEILAAMREEDILMITADHGNDPIHSGFDHTREYVPIVLCGAPVKAGTDIGTRKTFADCGRTITDYLGVSLTAMGESFLGDISK
jgi:phosphopentomutase